MTTYVIRQIESHSAGRVVWAEPQETSDKRLAHRLAKAYSKRNGGNFADVLTVRDGVMHGLSVEYCGGERM